jgi:hypothetical protein
MKTIMKSSIWMLSVSLMLTLTMVSCKKNTETVEGSDVSAQVAAEEDAITDAVYNNVFDDVMGVDNEVGLQGPGFLGTAASGGSETNRNGQIDSLGGFTCLTITKEKLNAPAPFPVRVTFDFGSGCVGNGGHFRKGKIVTIYTGRLITPGSVATTTFVNYQVDSFKIEGTHTIKNLSTPQEFKYEVVLVNGKVTNINNGKFRSREAIHTVKQVAGLGTPLFPLDDIFQITGGARGESNRNGSLINWERTILPVEPIIKKFTCHWLVKGQVKIERTNKPTAVLDYGNGDCDNLATVTVNGVTHNIVLPW